MTAKRTERIRIPRQLRVDEETVRAIRELADRDMRTIPLELLWLIEQGIRQELGTLKVRDIRTGTK